MSERLTPKYLTNEVADLAILTAVQSIQGPLSKLVSRQDFHVVVLVPSVEDARKTGYSNYPDYPIAPVVLCEYSSGNPEAWSFPFADIARCKALQLWRGQNTDGNMSCEAHLLFPDDTPFWGGVKRHGIVVACSGVQPYFDQMVSGMIADIIRALARHAFETSDDKKEDRNFLA